MKHYIIYTTLLACFSLSAGSQIHERVYLQTDKQLYIAGELMWMKLYTTDETGKPVSFSKVGYVELLSDSLPEVQVKIDITNGIGTGYIELPHVLVTGHYRLTAYTRHMRNEGEAVFFHKPIGVVNLQHPGAFFIQEANLPPIPVRPASDATVSLSTDQVSYLKRSKGLLTIKGLPLSPASLAVSIAGVDTLSQLNYSITDWQQQHINQQPGVFTARLQPEYEGPVVDAQLIDIPGNHPIFDPSVQTFLSFPGNHNQLFAGQQTEGGHITFYTDQSTLKKEIATVTSTPQGKRYRVDIRSPFASHTRQALSPLQIDTTWKDYLALRNLSLQVTQAFTSDSLSRIRPVATYPFQPFQEYKLDEYTRFPRMEDLFIEFILSVRIRKIEGKRFFSIITENRSTYTNGYVLVLLDNIPVLDHDLICAYNPLLVEKISIYQGNYVYGDKQYDGIISFKTFKHDFPGITFPETTQVLDYNGTLPYRYFYMPAYTEATASTRMPDFRHTLLWEPAIETNGQNEITIPFYTSDLPGRYIATVEGIDANGHPIHATCTLEITGSPR